MKVLITGGAGFIGGHAVRHFKSCGDEVLNVDCLNYASNLAGLDRKNFIQLDISKKDEFERIVKDFLPEYVINFAAETHVDNSISSYSEFLHSNIIGTASVVSACKNLNIKLCHVSTDEVYGPALDIAFTEEDRLNPMNPYAASKAAGDLFIKSFHNTYKNPYIIVRPSNNYGSRQHKEKFIPKLLSCLEDGKKFPLYGDGNQVREWTHVKDTVSVIRKLLIAENAWCSTYNLTSSISMTNNQVIDVVVKEFNRQRGKNISPSETIEYVIDRQGHDRKYFINPQKLTTLVQHSYTDFWTGIQEILTIENQHE